MLSKMQQVYEKGKAEELAVNITKNHAHIEALNATGIVRAYQDKPGHVRVDPVVGTLADWRAGGSEHICTIAVKSVSVKWYGGK